MDFMFSWQELYLTRSLRSLVRYSSCHSNIKSITSRHRVISSMYYPSVGQKYAAIDESCDKHQKTVPPQNDEIGQIEPSNVSIFS